MTIRPELAASGGTRSFHIDILEQSKKGLARVILGIFRKYKPDFPKTRMEITDETEETLFKRIFDQAGQIKSGEPILSVQNITFTRGTDYLNRHVMMTSGINAGLMKDRQHVLVIHAYPYIVDFNISLYTDDTTLMRAAIAAMGYVEEQRIEYSVDLDDPKFSFGIRTVFPDSFTYPPLGRIGGDLYTGYNLNFQVGMRTYMVRAERVPTLEKIRVVPHAATAIHYDKIKESVEAYNAGISDNEDWSESDLEFTLDLGKYADSDTND